MRAGLSLYEIAVMCCRNDNMGEAPSKLEVLFSMAAELAESAVENGRWHHAAASRALQDQLSPKGGSLLSPTAFDAKGVHKAASAINLSALSEGLAALVSEEKKTDAVPSMAPSSASDSGSDNGEDENEARDEWAASVIADVSLDVSFTMLGAKPRSHSIESDSSNDSDGGGFWYRSPGSSPDSLDDSDTESINWTPNNSPPQTSFFEQATTSLKKTYNPFAARRNSIIVASTDTEVLERYKSPARVTFSEQLLFGNEREKRDLGSKLKHSNSDLVSIPAKPAEGTLKRSQSYSAISSSLSEKKAAEDEAKERIRTVDSEKYRDYFMKFVDLVIVRETTAASQLLKPNSN